MLQSNTPLPCHAHLHTCSFETVEKLRAEIRRKELLERKLAGELEEGEEGADEDARAAAEELEGELGQDEAKIDETEDAGARRGCLRCRAVLCAG